VTQTRFRGGWKKVLNFSPVQRNVLLLSLDDLGNHSDRFEGIPLHISEQGKPSPHRNSSKQQPTDAVSLMRVLKRTSSIT
jgi:hypothetical protein